LSLSDEWSVASPVSDEPLACGASCTTDEASGGRRTAHALAKLAAVTADGIDKRGPASLARAQRHRTRAGGLSCIRDGPTREISRPIASGAPLNLGAS
jgi:hypothetical protein